MEEDSRRGYEYELSIDNNVNDDNVNDDNGDDDNADHDNGDDDILDVEEYSRGGVEGGQESCLLLAREGGEGVFHLRG